MIPANVCRTCCRHAELALVELAESIALGAVVIPQPICTGGYLPVEQCIVLDRQQVVIRPVDERDVWRAVKQVEVLLRDGGQLGIERGRVEVNSRVLPTHVAEDIRTCVVLVTVLLGHIEPAQVAILHEV